MTAGRTKTFVLGACSKADASFGDDVAADKVTGDRIHPAVAGADVAEVARSLGTCGRAFGHPAKYYF